MPHEQVAVLEQFRHPLLDPPGPTGPAPGRSGVARPPPRQRGRLRRQAFADAGRGMQDGLGQFLEDMELAHLVGNVAEHQGNGLRVQRRATGRDAQDGLIAGADPAVEPSEEAEDAHLGRVVVQDLVEQAPLPTGSDGRQHTEGAVVQRVGCQVAGGVSQGPIQVVGFQPRLGLFSPPPPPSSGWWHGGRRRGGPATGARRPLGKVGHLRRRGGRPGR
jgi:hypothetical protein